MLLLFKGGSKRITTWEMLSSQTKKSPEKSRTRPFPNCSYIFERIRPFFYFFRISHSIFSPCPTDPRSRKLSFGGGHYYLSRGGGDPIGSTKPCEPYNFLAASTGFTTYFVIKRKTILVALRYRVDQVIGESLSLFKKYRIAHTHEKQCPQKWRKEL